MVSQHLPSPDEVSVRKVWLDQRVSDPEVPALLCARAGQKWGELAGKQIATELHTAVCGCCDRLKVPCICAESLCMQSKLSPCADTHQEGPQLLSAIGECDLLESITSTDRAGKLRLLLLLLLLLVLLGLLLLMLLR